MARYFFNVRDGVFQPDVDGMDLPTVGHAQREAIRMAGYLLMTQPGNFWNGEEWFVETANTAGDVLFYVKFQAVNVLVHNDAPLRAIQRQTITR